VPEENAQNAPVSDSNDRLTRMVLPHFIEKKGHSFFDLKAALSSARKDLPCPHSCDLIKDIYMLNPGVLLQLPLEQSGVPLAQPCIMNHGKAASLRDDL